VKLPGHRGELTGKVDAIAVGQADVDERRARLDLPGDFDRACDRPGLADLDPVGRDHARGKATEIRVVVDDEDTTGHTAIIARRPGEEGRASVRRDVRIAGHRVSGARDANVGRDRIGRPAPRRESTCAGECAAQWPPVRDAGRVLAGTGTTAFKLGTTPRTDGARQVTYNGHPVYLFIGDRNPGDTNGQGINAFGGGWFAVNPAGDQVSGTGSGNGLGY
jgi:Secreted repeat of unknown function